MKVPELDSPEIFKEFKSSIDLNMLPPVGFIGLGRMVTELKCLDNLRKICMRLLRVRNCSFLIY